MKYDAIVVGGGMAGLTAAAYIAKSEKKVALFEKENKIGGLVNSFEYKGFMLDGGIRAMEDLGILLPMLNQLGIKIDFTDNLVSIGMEDEIVNLKDAGSLYEYQKMLNNFFPENKNDIEKIIAEIKKIMGYMDIQYGIENPVFKDIKNDKEYLMNILLPWLFKYIFTVGKVKKLYLPVEHYLAKLTDNQVLIDMIAQHFFTNTPAYFAMSYFTLYLNYRYPMGGTGKLPEALGKFIEQNGGEIKLGTKITQINPQSKIIKDDSGNEFEYSYLVWAADMKCLYSITDIKKIKNTSAADKAQSFKEKLENKRGGDSVFTLYLTCDLDKSYFEKKSGPHLFYTPYKKGLSNVGIDEIKSVNGEFVEEKEAIASWLKDYFKYTTYEIANPVMRDESLAPKGKSSLIISTLIEYSLIKHIEKMGWYEEFKKLGEEMVVKTLSETIFPELKSKVENKFSSTPLTIERNTGNTDGAITGWAFTNDVIPAVSNLPSIAKSVLTSLPDVYQAGQWTFSPSGLPISIITGKMAADKVLKKLK